MGLLVAFSGVKKFFPNNSANKIPLNTFVSLQNLSIMRFQ